MNYAEKRGPQRYYVYTLLILGVFFIIWERSFSIITLLLIPLLIVYTAPCLVFFADSAGIRLKITIVGEKWDNVTWDEIKKLEIVKVERNTSPKLTILINNMPANGFPFNILFNNRKLEVDLAETYKTGKDVDDEFRFTLMNGSIVRMCVKDTEKFKEVIKHCKPELLNHKRT